MRKRSVIFILCMCATCCSFALSGKEHAADMQRVFPFEVCDQNKRVLAYYRLVNKYLDAPGQNPHLKYDRSAPKRPASIANHPKFGNIHWQGGHRIWFHWGFNTDPHQFPPLVNGLEAAIEANIISRKDLPEFWSLLTKEISLRNRALMNDGAVVFGFGQLGTISSQQRKQLNGLVTVLYSIHVIGDHETSDTEVLAPLNRVYADVSKAIDNIAGKNPPNQEKAKVLKASLKKAQKNPTVYLDALERGFSDFLLSLQGEGYDYKAKFKKMGYVLSEK